MIELYTADTPNGQRAELMLEEIGLPYRKQLLSLSNGEHRTAAFRKLNPSAQIPVIVDQDTPDGMPFVLTQSAAILLYLAEKTGKLLPAAFQDKARALEWLSMDATDMASTRFDAFWLSLAGYPEAAGMLRERAMAFYVRYDQHLTTHEYLAGNAVSVADVAAYPWAKAAQPSSIAALPHLQRWMQQMAKRPASQKVFPL